MQSLQNRITFVGILMQIELIMMEDVEVMDKAVQNQQTETDVADNVSSKG